MRESSVNETRLLLLALACFIGSALLGAYVSSRPPMTFDLAAYAIRGQATPLALFFTALGRWYVLLPLALAGAAAAFALRANVVAIPALFASQVVSQGANQLLKLAFDRVRPAHPLLAETDLSFPSGHAVTAVVFYLGLLLLVTRSGVVPRVPAGILTALLAMTIVGIPWSRVALGAHYATDVAGGLLFGGGWLCLTIALWSRVAASRVGT
jgi:membrane-associated phospholipid phosphatase